ncbi:MAG: sulfatase [Armatimonadetes bacterium CG06_land_8_20_14_3_00_66_21]|nr:sulfatase-like hydrolase/transferase [Armatimonadota bacterium]PIU94700.1 MAG: sulfatase [Armatimonadetes bacterium CG06_land_8_20_14_3_00_66_21]PIX48322.1 MAG: sulfatase [Armatimonadetes bacterium CG_4_8_14_3_um_filter_66_20]
MKQPNLLVIMSDQHNPHMAGFAGDAVVRTPNLDRLAGGGVTFPQTYCAGPLCVPSRLTFLTSRYPSDLEVWVNGAVLGPGVPTFAHQLSLAGYETVLCGRMHFVDRDQNHGFARRLVGDVSGAMRVAPGGLFEGVWNQAGCGQDHRSLLDDAVGPGTATYAVYDDVATRRACAYLRDYAAQGSAAPFCLVVGLLLPHNPYVCPKDLFDEYRDTLPDPVLTPPADEHPALQQLRATRGTAGITREQARRARAAYYGLVTCLDRNVGAILDTLAETPCAQDTAVVYTSDHGDLNGEHGMWWKDCFYEGAVGIPMVWSWPSTFCQGHRVEAATSLLDVGPTLAELGGADPLPERRGHSLTPFLYSTGDPAGWPDAAYAETYAHGQRPARMIRSGRWKLSVYHGYDTPQLFDLQTDPGETTDLGRDPAFGEVRRELHARVTRGWDGDWVEARCRLRSAELATVQAWLRAGGARESECWEMPRGCNVRAPG